MSVHIGELHTEVVPASATTSAPTPQHDDPDKDIRRAEQLRRRVASEGFDD
jgi:hypothetical protein